jgi:hypothetical protein
MLRAARQVPAQAAMECSVEHFHSIYGVGADHALWLFHPGDVDLSLETPVERKPRRILSLHSTPTVKLL